MLLPDTITVHLRSDHAWLLGVFLAIGVSAVAIGAVWWAIDVLRWLHNNYRRGRKVW